VAVGADSASPEEPELAVAVLEVSVLPEIALLLEPTFAAASPLSPP
jgi:hypothetical protein